MDFLTLAYCWLAGSVVTAVLYALPYPEEATGRRTTILTTLARKTHPARVLLIVCVSIVFQLPPFFLPILIWWHGAHWLIWRRNKKEAASVA